METKFTGSINTGIENMRNKFYMDDILDDCLEFLSFPNRVLQVSYNFLRNNKNLQASLRLSFLIQSNVSFAQKLKFALIFRLIYILL